MAFLSLSGHSSTLSFMNVRLLLWLNHALAAHPTLYGIALIATDAGADVALLLTAAWLWFWPPSIPRAESRARLLLLGAGGIAAYVMARLLAFDLDMARPFVTYLPVRGTPGAFEGLRTFGAFPSDHAALLAALPVAFRYWNRRLALVWGVLAVLLSCVRVAVGFHYPSDMLAGAALGALSVAAAMAIYDRSAVVRRATGSLATAFARPRHALVLYPVLALIGVEFAMHFAHVLWALFLIRQWFA